jgi:hypothetical protein
MCLALFALGGCGSDAPAEPAGSATSDQSESATADDGSAVPGDQGGSVAPNSESSPEAAQAYLECLTDAGVGAAIVDETRVVLVADVDGGSASSAEVLSQAEAQCHEQVPDYHEPDFNER